MYFLKIEIKLQNMANVHVIFLHKIFSLFSILMGESDSSPMTHRKKKASTTNNSHTLIFNPFDVCLRLSLLNLTLNRLIIIVCQTIAKSIAP